MAVPEQSAQGQPFCNPAALFELDGRTVRNGG